MFALCVYVLIFTFIIIHLIFKIIVKIELGTPPIGSLIIAYKYSCGGYLKNFFRTDMFSSSSYNAMRLYYTDQLTNTIEYAQGVILSETGEVPDKQLIFQAKRNGFSFIKTPAIPHAIYIVFPMILCLSITKIFAIFIGYPKIRRYSEKRNLCGYPVLEIYSKDSVVLVVPLIRQDEFVVHEAESIVYGRDYSSIANINVFNNGLETLSNPFPAAQDSKMTKVSKQIKRETKG